jgi:hypothetical protein
MNRRPLSRLQFCHLGFRHELCVGIVPVLSVLAPVPSALVYQAVYAFEFLKVIIQLVIRDYLMKGDPYVCAGVEFPIGLDQRYHYTYVGCHSAGKQPLH